MITALVVAATAALTQGVNLGEHSIKSGQMKPDATEAQIIRLAERIRADILRGKVDAILELVPPDGMGCGDEKIPRARVERDLSEKGTYVNALLFDSATLRERYSKSGNSVSFQEKFRQSPRGPIVVTFLNFPGQDPNAFPCANFHFGDDYPETVCFFRRGGKWRLTDSFYECE
jgi:hypothetical protein